MTTYLRVKRPRHVDPPSSLRVEGLGEEGNKRARPNTVENLAELLHQSTYIREGATLSRSNTLPLSNTSAVWRRVDHANQKRSFPYVDAVLLEEEEDGGEPNTKRRRLALTLLHNHVKPTVENKTPLAETKRNIILDPRSRLVQESLESVLTGKATIAQHLDFLANDSRLCDTPRVWLAWQDVRTHANVLHAAALLNDVEGASSILAWNVPSLVTCQNEHGQTPFQVATAVGHDQVAQVLEQQTNNAMMEHDDDYVYDVFCLDKEMKDNASENEQEPLNVELKGGIGYWNENGDLVLEAMQDVQEDSTDEEDSNCEEHVANDYPEEEEAEELWDSDEEEDELDFRHRPIYMGNAAGVQVASGSTLVDEDEEYDAQYDFYEPSGPSREYAYDPDLDGESDD